MQSKKRDDAAYLISSLLYRVMPGPDGLDSDDYKLIGELVGCLIDAAKDELRSELLGESKARKCTLAEVLDDPTNLANT